MVNPESRTTFQVDVTPDGKTVYFSDGGFGHCGNIYAIATRGGPVREIARGAFAPAVSPDGRKLAYDASHVCGDRRHRMVVRDLESGSEREWLGTWEGGYGSPVWAPDARFLIVARSGADSARYFLLDTRNAGTLEGKSWPRIENAADLIPGIDLNSPGVTIGAATVRPRAGTVAFGVYYSESFEGEVHPIIEWDPTTEIARIYLSANGAPLDFDPIGRSLIYFRYGGAKLKLFRFTDGRSFYLGKGFHSAAW